MEKLLVGKIIDSFSLDGTLKVFSTTSNPEKRYKKGNVLFIRNKDNNEVPHTVVSYKKNGKVDLVRFEDITTPEEAHALKGYEILCNKDYSDLDEGYYFFSDLVDCELINNNKVIGKVIAVEEFPAQITLRCKQTNGREFFVPFIKEFIQKIDIENKKIEIVVLEGML